MADEDRIGGDRLLAQRWSLLAEAIEKLAAARSLDAVVETLRSTARRIVGADGIAIVLRDGDRCHYVAEDAKEPLWAGLRFPLETCVSGWAMTHGETTSIPDVFQDVRVPVDAYRVTFVKSMVMVPIGRPEPVAAMGAYWSETAQATPNEIMLLETLARSAATALENGRLFGSLEELNAGLAKRVEERTAELVEAQETLRQTQKLEAIGQLTGNVAHDFNNLLAPIIGGLDLILRRGAEEPAVARSATLAMEAAERAKTLVQRLLSFARRQPLLPAPVDLPALVDGIMTLLASTLGSRIGVRIDAAPGLPPAKADRHQLEMAILNLALNARDAMPHGGDLTIALRAGGGPASLPPGDYVSIAVRDTGAGMDEATLARAAEPFFSTKREGHGTGLGLSMVQGLAAQLGGALEIGSAPGRGTEVLIWLPAAKAAAPVAATGTGAPIGDAGGETVLVIDDELIVRKGTAEMLADVGFDVIQAENAAEGLTLIDAGLNPDVVVTDHIMPGMTGAELAQKLRAEHPEFAVLIISGYQGIDLIAPDVVRLSKPFRQKHLMASIAAAREKTQA
jgi:signal transduction histidine kinase